VRRAQAKMELDEARAAEQNIDGRTDFRMQHGSRIKEDPFIKGKRGADHNLKETPDQIVRRFGKERFDLEREPQYPIGFEDPNARDKRMISEIRRERAEANILRAANPRVNIAPNADGALLDPGGIGNLNRLGDIRDVGNLKAKMPAKAGGFNEGQYFPEAAQDGINPAFDANGIPLGIQGPAAANLPTPDNALNAPRDVRQWAIQNAPDYRDGGRIYGDFPQVDIGGVGNDFLARIGNIKAKKQAFDPGISAIRNIEDLQGVVDRFGSFAEEGGLKMFQLDANNNEVFRDKVGLPEIFQKMKMNPNGQGKLANMLFQLEAAKANGVNNEQRALFERGLDQFGNRGAYADVFIPNLVNGGDGVANIRIPQAQVQFGARMPQFGNDEVQLQKIPRGAIEVAVNEGGRPAPRLNIGVDAVGVPIKQELMAALQGLQGNQAEPPLDANELRDARNGMVGLVQGEGRGDYGFAKPIPNGADDREYFMNQARDRAKGKAVDIGRVNRNVDRRRDIIANEAAARNADNQVLGVVGTAERQLQEKGALFPKGRAAFQGDLDEGWRGDPERNQPPGKVIMSPEQIRKRRGFTPGAESAPDAFSMPKGNPIEAQRAAPNQQPLSGISFNETTPDPWQTPPATGGGFTGPTQGPRTPGIRQKIMNSIKRAPTNFVAAPRRQRVGAVAGGAILGAMGIDGLIGGERNKREEEQYQ
jgi:hypothetical protein